MGQAEGLLSCCEEAITHIKQAFRLSPRDPLSGWWHVNVGLSELCLGRADAAAEEIRRAIDGGYRPYLPCAFLAAIEANRGNDAEAQSALAEARRLNPKLTVKWFAESIPSRPIVLDGLRNAGLPEE
jgi:tetratricopeptide (TPR) repeat protein